MKTTRTKPALIVLLIMTLSFFTSAIIPVFAQKTDTTASTQPSLSEVGSNQKFFTSDHSILRYDDTFLEAHLYALIDPALMSEEPVDTPQVQVRYQIIVKVFDGDSLLTGEAWVRTSRAASKGARPAGQKIPEHTKFIIRPGEYRVEVEVVDLVSLRYQVEEFLMKPKAFEAGEIGVSDIIIASRIERADSSIKEFNFNGLLVLPNSERLFGETNPVVFYYAEIYNLPGSTGSTYSIKREILDDTRTAVKTLDTKTHKVLQPDVVDVDRFSIATLRTGTYTLVLTVTDDSTGQLASSERKFWVYRPEEIAAATTPSSIPGLNLDEMTDQEVKDELKMISYIVPSKVQSQIRELSPTGMKTFLLNFWLANDPDKTTPINELRDEYMKRVKEVDIRYGAFKREGWRTDRGRVYLMLGEPSHIEDHPFEASEGKAYQVWTYDNVEGGVLFVFVDRNGYGDYVQVHSTKSGELSNYSWYQTEIRGF